MAMTFRDPPANSRIGRWSYDWTAVREALMKRPGEWAVLDEDKSRLSVANALRDSKITSMRRSDGIEITQTGTDRSVQPAMCLIYLRYVPENDENAEN